MTVYNNKFLKLLGQSLYCSLDEYTDVMSDNIVDTDDVKNSTIAFNRAMLTMKSSALFRDTIVIDSLSENCRDIYDKDITLPININSPNYSGLLGDSYTMDDKKRRDVDGSIFNEPVHGIYTQQEQSITNRKQRRANAAKYKKHINGKSNNGIYVDIETGDNVLVVGNVK